MKAIVAMVLLACACTTDGPFGPNDVPDTSLPPLEDAIPYDVLGSGTLVFSRVGPHPGEYAGIYVIDIDNRQSWAFNPYEQQPEYGSAPGHFALWNGPTVSPDGTSIAIRGGIWAHVVSIDGSNMACVSCGLEYGVGIPAWSPDGSKLYFWSYDDLYAQSPVANPTDRTLIASISTVQFSGLSVGPTGAVIFPSGLGIDSAYVEGLFVIDEVGNEPRPLITDTIIHTDTSTQIIRRMESPAWSPDGTKIAYLERVSVYGAGNPIDSLALIVAPADGASRTTLLRRTISTEQWGVGIFQSVVWSPDGSKLLFNIPEADFVSHLYLINADGSGLQAITTEPGVTDRSASWSR